MGLLYLSNSGGSSAPPVTANLILNLDAQRETGYLDASDVVTPVDQSGANVDAFTQGGAAALVPHWRSGANGIGGHPAFSFNGTQQRWESAAFASASGNFTFYLVVHPGTTGDEYYFDSLHSGDRLYLGNDGGDVGYYDGAWDLPAAATTDAQILTYVLNSTGTAGAVYRNGAQLGVSTAYTAQALGSAVTIGSRYNGLANWYEGLLGQILIYTGAHSATDRGATESFLSSRWGVALA